MSQPIPVTSQSTGITTSSAPSAIASTPSVSQVTPKNENWYRIASLVYDAILPALNSILHNDNKDQSYMGLPRKEADLYNELSTNHKPVIDNLLHRRTIDQNQYDLLLPVTGLTNSKYFVEFDQELTEKIETDQRLIQYISLSGGEKRKVNLAVMMALKDLLLLTDIEDVEGLLQDVDSFPYEHYLIQRDGYLIH